MTVFDNELRDMTAAALPEVQAYYDLGPLETEFPYGASKTFRTDIAGVRIDPDALRERARRFGRQTDLAGTVAWKPLTSGRYKWEYLKPYLWLREIEDAKPDGDALTRDDWRDRCPWSSTEKIWRWLTAENYVQADDPAPDDFGFIRQEARVADLPLSGEQFAVELKPRDWCHAFHQAHRATHGRNALDLFRACPRRENAATGWAAAGPENVDPAGYANRAVVVLDADHIDAAERHREVFERAGVGLCALDRDELVEVVSPRFFDQPDYTPTRLHLNERTLPSDFEL